MLLLTLLLLSMPLMSISADAYLSNSIGQQLDAISQLTQKGYEIEIEGDVENFYQDGILIRKITNSRNTRTVEEGGTITTSLNDDNGTLLSETVETEERTTRKEYEYTEDGILSRVIESTDGEISKIISYRYSPETQLSAVFVDSPNSSVSYVGASSFGYMENDVPVRITQYTSMMVRDVGTVDQNRSVKSSEDGFLTIRESVDEQVVESTYRPDGSLSVRNIYDSDERLLSSEKREYRDSMLVSASLEEGDERVVTLYTDGHITHQDYFKADILQRYRDYNSDLSFIETVCRNGIPYARIGYDADGIRVISLEML